MTSSGFGWVKYEGKIYEHDVLITVSGKILPRNEAEIVRKYGTMHAIDADEIKFLLNENPEFIVIGTGHEGCAKLTSDAKALIMKSPAKLIEGQSPAACKRFDSLTERKAAIIHITC